jgi:hypothetical protein
MTVAELRALLEAFPGDMPVLSRDSREDFLYDPEPPRVIEAYRQHVTMPDGYVNVMWEQLGPGRNHAGAGAPDRLASAPRQPLQSLRRPAVPISVAGRTATVNSYAPMSNPSP